MIENNDNGTCMVISSLINKLDRTSKGKGYKKGFTYQDAYVCFGEDRNLATNQKKFISLISKCSESDLISIQKRGCPKSHAMT